jgi:integrase/recombinase XerD
MTPLRQHMIAALQLSGKGERTQQAYVREVRLLAQFYHKSPDRISEQELQHYFLHRKNVDSLAPTSMRICYSGIRFFYQHVLQRDWHTLALIRAQTTHRLPAVLSVEEVRRLLTGATPLHNQIYFTTVYSLGLRLHEALFLQVSDIDGQRLQVHVHRGKGAKDRYVPLPEETLALLRTYWKTHRHKTWLFPATGRDQKQRSSAAYPMRRTSVQTPCWDHQNGRRYPYPEAFLRYASARSWRESPAHPALPGAHPTRNYDALLTPHPQRS